MQTSASYSLPTKAFIISFGKIINRLSALFAIIYLSYHLPKSDYGSYRQVWILFNTLVPVLSLGIPISVNYFFPLLEQSEKKSFIFQTYFSLSVLGFLFTLLFLFGAPSFGALFNNPQIVELVKYFSLIPFLALPTLFYQNLFVCLDNPLLATKVSLIASLGYFLTIIVPLEYGYSIIEMIYCLTVFYLIQFICVSYLYYNIFKEYSFNFNFSLIIKQFKYAIPVGFTSAIGIISINIDNLFVSSYFSSSKLAEYANGAMELPFIGIVTGSIMAVLMPEFVKRYNDNKLDNVIQLWHSSVTKVATLFFPMMCFLFIFSDQFIVLFFSEKYMQSAEIFRIYLLQLPCRITIFGIILLSMNKTSFVLRSTVLCLLINFFLNLILINKLGIVGPAIATIISLYFISLIQLFKISFSLKSNIFEIFPWKYLITILLFSIIPAMLINFIDLTRMINFSSSFVSNVLIISVGGFLYLIIFILLCFMSGLIDRDAIMKSFNNAA